MFHFEFRIKKPKEFSQKYYRNPRKPVLSLETLNKNPQGASAVDYQRFYG
jgi:hypothetical protein